MLVAVTLESIAKNGHEPATDKQWSQLLGSVSGCIRRGRFSWRAITNEGLVAVTLESIAKTGHEPATYVVPSSGLQPLSLIFDSACIDQVPISYRQFVDCSLSAWNKNHNSLNIPS